MRMDRVLMSRMMKALEHTFGEVKSKLVEFMIYETNIFYPNIQIILCACATLDR